MVIIEFKKEELIKSPINYTGNKYKLLPQILPLFPDNIHTFYDLFGGSFTVGININCNKIVYNDYNTKLQELIKWICEFDTSNMQQLFNIINNFKLGKNTKKEYYAFRDYYNVNQNPMLLYILSCFSFNYNIRFNSKGEFNMPCGNRGYSKSMQENFIKFSTQAKTKNIEFNNNSFEYILDLDLKENDFVYADPCYLPTAEITTYGENNEWNLEKELKLYNVLDKLNKRKIKWALSNLSWYRGEENKVLNEWSSNYNIHNLNHKYKNNNSHRKDNTALTQEVLITNY